VTVQARCVAPLFAERHDVGGCRLAVRPCSLIPPFLTTPPLGTNLRGYREAHRAKALGSCHDHSQHPPGGQIVMITRPQASSAVTCVPGESYLAALDALHDRPIATSMSLPAAPKLCGQDGEAYGQAHHRPPESASSPRGPGCDQCQPRVQHIAMQASTP